MLFSSVLLMLRSQSTEEHLLQQNPTGVFGIQAQPPRVNLRDLRISFMRMFIVIQIIQKTRIKYILWQTVVFTVLMILGKPFMHVTVVMLHHNFMQALVIHIRIQYSVLGGFRITGLHFIRELLPGIRLL